jgi:hypothetical protein
VLSGRRRRRPVLVRDQVRGAPVALPVLAAAADTGSSDWGLWIVLGVGATAIVVWLVSGLRHTGGVLDTMPLEPALDPLPPPAATPEARVCLNLARRGDVEQLRDYVCNGVDADLADEDGTTPLMVAAHNGHRQVVRTLVAHGADVNRLNQHGHTPLTCAVLSQQSSVVRLLIRLGADPDQGAPSARDVAASIGRPDLIPAP